MIDSRRLEDLQPIVSNKIKEFIALCANEGIDLLITSTYRDNESQDALYSQGRTTKGFIVTNARGGESFHNWRVAADVVPLRNGKPVWGTSGPDGDLWNKIGLIGESCGLEWAGRWKGKLRELAHFQYTEGNPIEFFKNGGTI